MKKTKVISLLVAVMMIASLASCKKDSGGYTYDHAADFREDEGEIFADVPSGEYGGYDFTILNAKNGLSSSKMDSESILGSNLSDAIYKRNRNVEARLNIKITEMRDTPENVYNIACQSVMADEDAYSAVWNSAAYMGSLAASGYLVSSDYLIEADYEKPWWNTDAMHSLSVDSKIYMLISDMQMSYYDAHSIVGVNMEIVSKIDGMPNPYSLVNRGNFTVSKMLQMMQMAESDVDGNGVMTYEDRFGAAIDDSTVLPLMFGANVKMTEKDEYDLPYITCIENEKFFDVYTLVTQSLYSRESYVYNSDNNPADNMTDIDMFKNSRSLFVITTVGELEELRSMDAEFGALPLPKYTSDQKDYISLLSGESIFTLGIPASGRNFLRTGVIIENLAAESYRESGVRDTYVDSVLSFKYVNDTESRKNLDTVLSSGVFDLAEIYGWGELAQTVKEEAAQGSEKLSSTLAGLEGDTKKDITAFIEMIEELE